MAKPKPFPIQRGQESVWDYPRPPVLQPVSRTLEVIHDGVLLARTSAGYRVLETSHPPVYYFPPADVNFSALEQLPQQSNCEWKGKAGYYVLAKATSSRVVEKPVAWSYPQPIGGFEAIQDYVAFYAGRVDSCLVDGERVTPQPGNFYGGWITADIVGPFKGAPGTWGW